jgi:hypothetical protein
VPAPAPAHHVWADAGDTIHARADAGDFLRPSRWRRLVGDRVIPPDDAPFADAHCGAGAPLVFGIIPPCQLNARLS